MTRSSSDNSGKRRKDAYGPLRSWHTQVVQLEREVRAQTESVDASAPDSDSLVLEVVRLSDPNRVRGLDVVIPGTRVDLARRWIEARLQGRGTSEADWLELAKEIAPLPDEHLFLVDDRIQGVRHASGRKEQDEVTRAAKGFFKSK